MTTPDVPTPADLLAEAVRAFKNFDHAAVASQASLAAALMLQQFSATMHAEPEWRPLHNSDGTPFVCQCGSTMFAQYPTLPEYEVDWCTCDRAHCDAVIDLAWLKEYGPVRLRPDPSRPQPQPAWQKNDLVRHRSPSGGEFVALLQHPVSDRPGWWAGQVLRAQEGSTPIVGQSVSLQEGADNNQVARFPD